MLINVCTKFEIPKFVFYLLTWEQDVHEGTPTLIGCHSTASPIPADVKGRCLRLLKCQTTNSRSSDERVNVNIYSFVKVKLGTLSPHPITETCFLVAKRVSIMSNTFLNHDEAACP